MKVYMATVNIVIKKTTINECEDPPPWLPLWNDSTIFLGNRECSRLHPPLSTLFVPISLWSTLDHDYIFGDKNLQLSLKVYMAHIYVQGSHNLQVTQKSLIYMDMHKSQWSNRWAGSKYMPTTKYSPVPWVEWCAGLPGLSLLIRRVYVHVTSCEVKWNESSIWILCIIVWRSGNIWHHRRAVAQVGTCCLSLIEGHKGMEDNPTLLPCFHWSRAKAFSIFKVFHLIYHIWAEFCRIDKVAM